MPSDDTLPSTVPEPISHWVAATENPLGTSEVSNVATLATLIVPLLAIEPAAPNVSVPVLIVVLPV